MDSADSFLDSPKTFVATNREAVSRLGAEIAVLRRFVDATLPQLTVSQAFEIAASFRSGIEETMALMDDVPLPARYHSTLLEQTDIVFAALDKKIVGLE